MFTHLTWHRGDVEETARWLGEDVDLLALPPNAQHLDEIVIAARIVATSGDAGLRQRVLAQIRMWAEDNIDKIDALNPDWQHSAE